MAPVQQAHLQRRLLLALDGAQAGSVAELAARESKTRTACSRALHALVGQRLVERVAGSWRLTDLGQAATLALRAEAATPRPPAVPRSVMTAGSDAAAAARAITGMTGGASTLLKDLGGVAAILRDVEAKRLTIPRAAFGAGLSLPTFAPSLALVDFGAQMKQSSMYLTGIDVITKRWSQDLSTLGLFNPGVSSIAALAGMQKASTAWASTLGGAVAEASAAQRAALDAVAAGSANRAWWTQMVAETLPRTAGIVGDLAAMDALAGSRKLFATRYGGALAFASSAVAAAYKRQVTFALAGLAPTPPSFAGAAVRSIAIPAAGSAEFVGGVRRMLEPPLHDQPDVEIEAGTKDLVERLEAIHPTCGEALLGAWDRLREHGHDWQRAAAHGAREALNQTLDRMAPDAVDPKLGKPTREARLRAILPSSATQREWVESIATGLETTIVLLNAEAHEHEESRFKSRGAMVGLLRSVEAILWVVVESSVE